MPQSLKHTPRWLTTAVIRPQSVLAGIRYRLKKLRRKPAKPIPDSILQGLPSEDENFRHLSFTFAVIALSARVACADGPMTREKYIAFRESFPLKGSVCGKIRSLFTLACHNETPLEHYAMQIKCMFPEQPALFSSLVERLFSIAAADGAISRAEERVLASIARILDISTAGYADILARYDNPRAHEIMGVEKRVKARTLKKRYHELMHRYHPDRFSGSELSPELRLLLQVRSSEINAAYRALAKRAA